ncbi:hypothetical protein [Arenimonas sp.]|uniref:hypothetical protein n=1 Tax=Arenimonas sp. TaxID=1872635 RepID=UPI002E323965|nr:hypothetical protein [Arenimonas sp.]HEX4855154.1 hypothetical protein [Arenimonas sp.]
MSLKAGDTVFIEGGGPLTLGPLVKSGGAGSVHLVAGDPRRVAKLYHAGLASPEYERKLAAMLALAPALPAIRDGDREHVQIAWPQALLRDRRGRFLGFLMPAVDIKATSELETILQERQARAHGLPTGLGAKLTLAANLASVIAALHDEGHHVVDLKPVNLRFYPRSLYMALLDCDGFSIQGQGERFPAPQFTPDYLAPEFQRQGLDDAGEQTQDRFALAVVAFQLLNFGLHPYAGRPASDQLATDLPGRIAQGAYAYGLRRNPLIHPSPVSGHEALPGELRRLFDQALGGGTTRPAAAEWAEVLRGYALRANQRLVACERDAAHQHFAGLACAACDRVALMARTARAAPGVRRAAAQQAAAQAAAVRMRAPMPAAAAPAPGRAWGVATARPAPAPPPGLPFPPLPPMSSATRRHLQWRRRRHPLLPLLARVWRKIYEWSIAAIGVVVVVAMMRVLGLANAPPPRPAPPASAVPVAPDPSRIAARIRATDSRALAASAALAAGDRPAFQAALDDLERHAAVPRGTRATIARRDVRLLSRVVPGGEEAYRREVDALIGRLTKDPEDAEAAFLSGWMLLHEGDRARAREYFARAVGAAPDFPAAWYGLGLSAATDPERIALLAVAETRFPNETAAGLVRSRFERDVAPRIGETEARMQRLAAQARRMAQPFTDADLPAEVARLAAQPLPPPPSP